MIARILHTLEGASGAIALLCTVLFVLTSVHSYSADQGPELEVLGCQLEPTTIAELSSSSRGKLARIAVGRGDVVRAGEILASMETAVEELNVKFAANRAAMKTDMESKEARLQLAQRSEQRTRELADKDMISSVLLDEAATESTVARLEATQAKEQYALAQVELERARVLLDQRHIYSTVDGVIVELYKEVGEFVDEEPILKLAKIDPLKVEVVAPVNMFGLFEKGAVFSVMPELAGIGPLEATVDVVDNIIDPGSGTFRVSLTLPNPDNSIPAGLNCQLRPL